MTIIYPTRSVLQQENYPVHEETSRTYGKSTNAEYHLDDQDITANHSNGGIEPGEGPKTSYQKPQPAFVPYPTPLTPEEVLGTALDNDPKRLKAPAYYNEVVFVSPFAKDRRLPDLCGEQIHQHPPAQVHLADRCALLGNVMRIGSERRRGYDGWSYDRDDVSDNEGIHVVIND
ncbi:hypothetical protein SELMODRAFT_425687 [Selaginella moellendorffii]|uniref:Uncharacterized protein n=1 Tax=Selaginella moellendorffii TaxID=88036 RepID=D8STY7_SELML|nr:hypothetical protein SELMODRAFT_425687 [Selaginella moellendorffii]